MQVDVAQVIQAMPDDKLCHMTAEGEHLAIQIEERDSTLKRLTDDKEKFNILMMGTRPGVSEFQTHLEHEYFSPNDAALNDLMQFRVIKWEGLMWNLVTIPLSMKQTAYDTAEAVNMRFEEGVLPFVAGGPAKVLACTKDEDVLEQAGWKGFPIEDTDRLVHLINAKDSDVYDGPLGRKDAEMVEKGRVRYYMKSKGITDRELDEPLICEVPIEDEFDPWEDTDGEVH